MISVCMSTYNGVRFIREQIDSIHYYHRLFGNRRKASESQQTVGFPLAIVHISSVFVTMIPYKITALFSLVTKWQKKQVSVSFCGIRCCS